MKNPLSSFVKALSVMLFFSAAIVGCQKNTVEPNGTTKAVSLFVTDDPSLVFDNIFVDIQKIEIKAEDESEVEHERGHSGETEKDDDNGSISGGWMTLNSKPQVIDILKFRNGLDTLFSTGSFQSNRSISKVRITLGNNNKAVMNGITSALKLKKNLIVINLEDEKIEQRNGDRVGIWLDIDAGRSIRKNGNEFEFEPGVNAFSKDKAGSIEGRVMPLDAKAVVMAINGSDTSTAKPGREGEFKIVGLKAANYKLVVHSTTNVYQDAVIQNIVVRSKEDSQAGTITLHK